jgi:transcriptional regulator with XRE-family HTH domain
MKTRRGNGRGPRGVGRILRHMATTKPRKKDGSFAAEFGARLRASREKRGMTQQQLAEGIDTYAPQISKYESGEVVPEGETLAALAAVLEVSLDELILGRPADRPDDVRDVRLRASIRELEELHDRPLIDVAVTVIDALVVQAHQSALHERVSQRRKR